MYLVRVFEHLTNVLLLWLSLHYLHLVYLCLQIDTDIIRVGGIFRSLIGTSLKTQPGIFFNQYNKL